MKSPNVLAFLEKDYYYSDPLFLKINTAINSIKFFLKISKEIKYWNRQQIKIANLPERKRNFITNLCFLKANQEKIKQKTGISYIEFMKNKLGDLTDTLLNHLLVFDLCVKHKNPILYFQLDDISCLEYILKYNDENLAADAFRKIEYNLYYKNVSVIINQI